MSKKEKKKRERKEKGGDRAKSRGEEKF